MHVKVLDKIVSYVIFVIFWNIFEAMFSSVSPPKETLKNRQRSLKWMWHPPNFLELFRIYIRFPTK